jgi:hypothetical protein
MAYTGIARGAKFSASNMEAALDTKISLAGNDIITGTKTFTTSPVVPEKDTAASNNPTAIATEVQVYKMENTAKENIRAFEDSVEKSISEKIEAHKTRVDNSLSSKLSLAGDESIDGLKTFTTLPVVPSKNTVVSSSDDTNSKAIATEAQVHKTIMCW